MAIHLKVLHALFQLLESENDSELLKIPLKGWWPQERPTNPMDGPTNMVFHLLHLHHLHLHNLITSFGVARKAPKPRDGGWRRDPALWDKAGLTARAAWQDAPMAILGSQPTPDPAMYICLTESRRDLVPCPLCPLCPLCLMLGPMFWSAVTFVAHRYQAHITLGPSCRSWQIKPSFSFKMLNKYCQSLSNTS